LGVSSHIANTDVEQMLNIPRQVDTEGLHSLEHEIAICTQEERLHVEKAATEDQPQANELLHEEA